MSSDKITTINSFSNSTNLFDVDASHQLQRHIRIVATATLALSLLVVSIGAIMLISQTSVPRSEQMWNCKVFTIMLGQKIGQPACALPAFLTIIGGTGALVSSLFLATSGLFKVRSQ